MNTKKIILIILVSVAVVALVLYGSGVFSKKKSTSAQDADTGEREQEASKKTPDKSALKEPSLIKTLTSDGLPYIGGEIPSEKQQNIKRR